MSELLEDTGYSYSGIHDVINNEPEKSIELLIDIDQMYNSVKAELELLYKKKDALESDFKLAESAFIHYHQCLKDNGQLNEDVLSFSKSNRVIVARITKHKQIEYSSYERCDTEINSKQ